MANAHMALPEPGASSRPTPEGAVYEFLDDLAAGPFGVAAG